MSGVSKYLEMISAQMDHLNNRVERILEISHIEKRSFRLHKKQTDLVQLIEKVTDSFIGQGRTFSIRLPDKPVEIMADEVYLTNILISLMDNAIKYSKPGTNIEIGLETNPKEVVFSIRDEGMGIDKKQFRRNISKILSYPDGDVHNVKGIGLACTMSSYL
jgi:two-component system phosphate regulon sensor histidine kinase PhoR